MANDVQYLIDMLYEMIDEASRKMALVISAKGRAAGMTRTSEFTPPEHA